MLGKTILAVSFIAGATVLVSYSDRLPKTNSLNQQAITITQLTIADIEKVARDITVQVHVDRDRGSGIIIAKDNDTYRVITNDHVVQRGETYTIQTPDGMKHEATLVNIENTEQDLAVLEFNSSNNYQVATIGNSDSVKEGEKVIAAGFPNGEEKLLVTEGNISLITEKPLNKGYSIGFSNETLQGMSGGVLLNSNGELIGVLGRGRAIVDTAYDYMDGTTPNSDEIAAYKQVSFGIPIANIKELSPQLAGLLPNNNVVETKTASQSEYTGIVRQVDDIAQQITVRITTPKLDSHGSGVIIGRNGNTYYVATAGHVLKSDGEYQIVTPDGETYSLNNKTINKSDAYDLAVFSFKSKKDYAVATVGNYTVGAEQEQVVFVSGFPNFKENTSPTRMLTGGKVVRKDEVDVTTKDTYSLRNNGQGLLYSNLSYGGMSGGAVLDRNGNLVGINTGAENELYFDDTGSTDELSLGFSIGESIQDIFNFLLTQTPLKNEWLQTMVDSPAEINEEEYSSIETQLLTAEQPEDDNLVAWMNYGNRLWRYEKFDEAIDAFTKVAQIQPNFDKAYYGMGLAYWYEGEYQQVVDAINKAIEINPSPYYYWRHLGFSYGQLNQYDKALAAYEQAIALNPQDFVLYLQRADVYRESGDIPQAIESYSEAAKMNPKHPWIYNNRGFAYAQLDKYDLALADLTKSIQLNPYSVLTYSNRGAVYLDNKQYDESLADLSKAISLAPEYADAYNNRGGVYLDLEKYEEALADYNKAIELDPQLAKAYYGRGNLYSRIGETDKAIADYDKSIEINPDFPYVYYNRGTTYGLLQQYENSITDLSKAIELKPDYADAYYNRGTAYNNLQQYDRGLKDLTKAINLDPKYTDAYINRGTSYQVLEQYEAAINDWTQAIALDPENSEAYFKRGGLYKDLKQTDKAIADLKKSAELNPQNAQAYVGLGLIYYELQDIPKTRENWEQAAALFKEQGQTELYQNLQGLLSQL